MSLDFLLRADTREDFEAMAKSQGFMDEAGNPVAECVYDPMPGTPEYETGIPIPKAPPGFYFNFRVAGALEAAQLADLPQHDSEGTLLPLRQRTTFGLWMTELGEEGLEENRHTTFVTAAGVSFIDPETVYTPQRVWQ